jgi:cytochrome c2
MDWLESGGRLAWLAGKLLLTVGDFGLNQTTSPPVSQNPATAYGKVHILDRSGQHEVFTIGHRNPQGLVVDREQRTWLTEHGPQGGDEINLLERGRNYGYPYSTYGTGYGRHYGPLAPSAHDHGEYTEPVHAFVPAIGISNLIRVASNLFSEWQNDLLVASLRGQSLYRVRLRDERAVYTERLRMGSRIRDITEAADGHILLWTGATVLVLAPSESRPIASQAFVRCQDCHEKAPGAEPLGPSLRGIVGSSVARDSAFPYSPELRKVGGKWTEERLDAFLKDPNAFAPGTTMPGEVADAPERQLLIDHLKRYR